MKKQNINTLFDEVNDLLMELAIISTENGIHLDNDLESGSFRLLLDDNRNEMSLLKNRIEVAIKKIENGTFKISNADEELVIHQQVA